MLPREILKIGMRRYAFFTILRYNFRKIRERICKVICTYIYNFYKIFEVTGKIKKKMFNMKKIMHTTVDPATFFLDVYARMSSPLLQNPSVCPCGHWQAQQCIQAPLKHRAAVVWLDESQGRFVFLFLLLFFFFFFFLPARGGGARPRAPPPLDPLLTFLLCRTQSQEEEEWTWKCWRTFAVDELTVVRRHWLFFFFFWCLREEGEDSERGETKFSAGVTVKFTAPTTMHVEEKQPECSQRHSKCEQEHEEAGSFRLNAQRTVQTRPVWSRSVHDGIFPDVYSELALPRTDDLRTCRLKNPLVIRTC